MILQEEKRKAVPVGAAFLFTVLLSGDPGSYNILGNLYHNL
jgi:hypothetical protein